jgi:hypothetical protein
VKSDRLARGLAAVALAIAAIAILVAIRAMSLAEESNDRIHDLSRSLQAALAAQPGHSTPLLPPPPQLDREE